MGTGSIIRPGEAQRMSAGTGVTHSEFNPSKTEPVHLLQIWILPEAEGIKPSYEQKQFDRDKMRDNWLLIASRDASAGAVKIHQDVKLFVTVLDDGQSLEYQLAPGRYAWLQIALGKMRVNGMPLEAGDGIAYSQERVIQVMGKGEALLFDLN